MGHDGHMGHTADAACGIWSGKWALRAGPREQIYFNPGGVKAGWTGGDWRFIFIFYFQF